MSKIFVVAGNKMQAEHFIQKKIVKWNASLTIDEPTFKFSDFQYVHSPDVFAGRKDPQGYFCGTWRERSDIKEIIHRIWWSKVNTVIPKESARILDEVYRSP
jgi:hypothetical protein